MQGKRYISWMIGIVILAGTGWSFLNKQQNESSEKVEDVKPPGAVAEQTQQPPVEVAPVSLREEKVEVLELNLAVNQRFPMIKTVEQTLSQASAAGVVQSKSKLELILALTVEELQEDGRKRLRVQYSGVKYSHDIAGEKVSFDSNRSSGPAPPEVQAYQGLVQNGFSFWIGPDNKIIELVGFDQFMQRCLQNTPVSQRETVLAKISETSGDDGVANFIDDSIGLLPYNINKEHQGGAVRVGESWTKTRRLTQPIPMVLKTEYTLRELNENIARINIAGDIAASKISSPINQHGKSVQLFIRGGKSFGSCLLDRQTGLPLESRIERFLETTVKLESGKQFEQQKQIVTTIRAFPHQEERPLGPSAKITPRSNPKPAAN
ncbi:hypothetical protein F1728_21620 [Gimesia benthica]|uniref:Uncharacterized protein n=1 Tax=Gimesia benthica TaxID=2608982 RepID=A0A6I6AGB8_9PLAN|nr:DUF6263 family protein [Gimesia benthica]QGQ25126.1 hypothetical protein F1728_21620 [Gimesia benthica]